MARLFLLAAVLTLCCAAIAAAHAPFAQTVGPDFGPAKIHLRQGWKPRPLPRNWDSPVARRVHDACRWWNGFEWQWMC